MRIAGPALTAKGTPTTIHKDEYLQPMLQVYMTLEPGVIAVYDSSADQMAAHWGELVSTAASVKGCRGAVIDGGVRDVDRIIEMGFPVFCRYRSPPTSVAAGATSTSTCPSASATCWCSPATTWWATPTAL